jgi:hypothetical protein
MISFCPIRKNSTFSQNPIKSNAVKSPEKNPPCQKSINERCEEKNPRTTGNGSGSDPMRRGAQLRATERLDIGQQEATLVFGSHTLAVGAFLPLCANFFGEKTAKRVGAFFVFVFFPQQLMNHFLASFR